MTLLLAFAALHIFESAVSVLMVRETATSARLGRRGSILGWRCVDPLLLLVGTVRCNVTWLIASIADGFLALALGLALSMATLGLLKREGLAILPLVCRLGVLRDHARSFQEVCEDR
jgi:hypothetical protein